MFQILQVVNLPGRDVLLVLVAGVLFAGVFLVAGRYYLRRASAQRVTESAPERMASVTDLLKRGRKERRASRRRAGTGVKVRLESAIPMHGVLEGRIMDRSDEGMGLLMSDELPVGTIVLTHPANGPEHIAWVRLEVMRKRWDGSRWEIGCRFLQAPPRSFIEALD